MSRRRHKRDQPIRLQQPAKEGVRHSGRVRWFSAERGYGFVNDDDDPETDIFLHHRNIHLAGFKVLGEGQRVLFTVSPGEKGPVALNVLPISNAGR